MSNPTTKQKKKETYIHSEYVRETGDSVTYCHWCVYCYKKGIYKGAVVIHRGDSVCNKHFIYD